MFSVFCLVGKGSRLASYGPILGPGAALCPSVSGGLEQPTPCSTGLSLTQFVMTKTAGLEERISFSSGCVVLSHLISLAFCLWNDAAVIHGSKEWAKDSFGLALPTLQNVILLPPVSDK